MILDLIYVLVFILGVTIFYKDGKKNGYKEGHKNGYKLGVHDSETCVCEELNEAYNAGIQKGKAVAQEVNLIVQRAHQANQKVAKKKVVKKKSK